MGPKGFVLLHVEGNRVKQEFVPFARRMLEEVQVDISGLTSGSRILAAAQDALRETNIENLVRLTLIGSYTPETRKDLNFLQKMLEGRFYLLKIRDESRLKFEKETYEHDISLKGEFIRLVMASDRSDEEKERIICYGIRALSGEEVE